MATDRKVERTQALMGVVDQRVRFALGNAMVNVIMAEAQRDALVQEINELKVRSKKTDQQQTKTSE